MTEPEEEDDNPHVTDGTPCWCSPTYERVDEDAFLIIHKDGDDAEN